MRRGKKKQSVAEEFKKIKGLKTKVIFTLVGIAILAIVAILFVTLIGTNSEKIIAQYNAIAGKPSNSKAQFASKYVVLDYDEDGKLSIKFVLKGSGYNSAVNIPDTGLDPEEEDDTPDLGDDPSGTKQVAGNNKLVIFGDSISSYPGEVHSGYNAFDFNNQVSLDKTYWKIVANAWGSEIVDNLSSSGSYVQNTYDQFYGTGTTRQSDYKNSEEAGTCIVFMGMNDYWNDQDGCDKQNNKGQFEKAYKDMLNGLMSSHPNTRYVTLSLYKIGDDTNGRFDYYNNAIKSAASACGAIFVDISGFDYSSMTIDTDNTHPNEAGMQYIADCILKNVQAVDTSQSTVNPLNPTDELKNILSHVSGEASDEAGYLAVLSCVWARAVANGDTSNNGLEAVMSSAGQFNYSSSRTYASLNSDQKKAVDSFINGTRCPDGYQWFVGPAGQFGIYAVEGVSVWRVGPGNNYFSNQYGYSEKEKYVRACSESKGDSFTENGHTWYKIYSYNDKQETNHAKVNGNYITVVP
jgi:lysophospholipase L1-like esterase